MVIGQHQVIPKSKTLFETIEAYVKFNMVRLISLIYTGAQLQGIAFL